MSRRSRPRFRFTLRLRTFLILTLVQGVVLGYCGGSLARAYRQHLAVEQLRDSGVAMQYDFRQRYDMKPPEFMVDTPLMDFVSSVNSVVCNERPTSLKTLAELPAIEYLALVECTVPKDQFASLIRMERLNYLCLYETGFGSNEMHLLGKLPNLKRLELTDVSLTEGDYLGLAKLQTLEELVVEKGRLSPATIEKLARAMPNCMISQIEM